MAMSSYPTRYGGRIKIGNFVADTHSMRIVYDNYGRPSEKTIIEVEIRAIDSLEAKFDAIKYGNHKWVYYKTLGQGIKMGGVTLLGWRYDMHDPFRTDVTFTMEVSYYEIRVL